MVSISLFKTIPFAEVRLIKTKHVYYNVQCTLVLWVLTFSYMHLSLLIKGTEIIKVIHVSSKFYGPGLIFMAPRHDATHSSMMTPISCPGGLSILSSCTQQHHHQQTPQGHRAESGPDPPDCWTSEQRLSLLLNTAVHNILTLNEIL